MNNEEFAFELLNGKRGNFEEIKTEEFPKGDVLFEDKIMKIVKVDQDIFIKTSWLGPIKNSFFKIDGKRGRFEKGICGKMAIKDLENYEASKKIDEKIVLRQRTGGIVADRKVDPVSWLQQYHQEKFKSLPVYSTPLRDVFGNWHISVTVQFYNLAVNGVGRSIKKARINAAEQVIEFK